MGHPEREQESERIDYQVPLAPLHLLSSVISTSFFAFLARLGTLAVQDAGCRRSGRPGRTIAVRRGRPNPRAESIVDLFHGAVVAPLPVVLEHLFPWRKVMWEV